MREIADQRRRLAPSRTDPHAYFQQKSDLVHELRTLALGLDQVVPCAKIAGVDLQIRKAFEIEQHDLPATDPKS